MLNMEFEGNMFREYFSYMLTLLPSSQDTKNIKDVSKHKQHIIPLPRRYAEKIMLPCCQTWLYRGNLGRRSFLQNSPTMCRILVGSSYEPSPLISASQFAIASMHSDWFGWICLLHSIYNQLNHFSFGCACTGFLRCLNNIHTSKNILKF